MAPSLLDAHSAEQLSDHLKKLRRVPNVFLLFLADAEPTTGQSWCPDCRKAEPVIASVLHTSHASNRLLTLIRVYVGDRATWRASENPFRKAPYFVTGVPTLGLWDGEKLAEGALGDKEADNMEGVKKLLGL